ncbi:MAG: hypothetical protein K6G00_01195 [Treponema sp.]|nr:hypothetical protein [Treponema sp.]
MKSKLYLCIGFIMALVLSFANASESTVKMAHRRTALRCLATASNYAMKKDWASAVSQCQLGLSYDESISDLWYIFAVGQNALGAIKADVLPIVEKSLSCDDWVDYNRDNARILYADILADTNRYAQVLDVLDSAPFVYSADAEYIRVKAYYRMGDAASVSNARSKIASARKIYPSDTRFPLLFFKYEDSHSPDFIVNQMADSFISQISQYSEAAPDKDAELEIYAASFATGTTRENLLKSFTARGLIHPMYAKVALESGLISEKEAFEYIASFADNEIDYSYFRDFLPLLTDEAVKKEANEYFTAYGGLITRDMSGDGIPDIFVKYYRGRPQSIYYDSNQDGFCDWNVECDFGIPVSGTLNTNPDAKKCSFSWNNFPYLSSFSFIDDKDNVTASFEIVSEELKWTPVRVEKDSMISSVTGTPFFFPVLQIDERKMTRDVLLNSCSSFTAATKERKDAYLTATILNGNIHTIDYFAEGTQYAHAQFVNNIPSLRIVDSDGDGVFETTEYYELDETGLADVHSFQDEQTVMTNLFGFPSFGAQFYLRMIQVDLNADTVPDFTEEYFSGKGKTSSWDLDGDGNWNVRVSIRPHADSEDVIEDDMFYDSYDGSVVIVTSVNSVPSFVSHNGKRLSVTKDADCDFYWVGDVGKTSQARKAVKLLKEDNRQGFSVVVESDNQRIHAVHVGNFYYGQLIPETLAEKEGN